VTDALCQIVFPAIDLRSYLGLTGTAANQGSQMFDEETTREAGGPAGDAHLQYIK